MARFCYCSKIEPGKTEKVRTHWANKKSDSIEKSPEAQEFRKAIGLKDFASWLQFTPQGDFMIHCLEGESLQDMFKGLREQIRIGNPFALQLQAFYLETLNKDYYKEEIVPQIECTLDISLSAYKPSMIRKGFIYPLLPKKIKQHLKFRQDAMGKLRDRHIATMKAFEVVNLTTWIQKSDKENYIIVYSERMKEIKKSPSKEWQEIAHSLMDHTGLILEQLTPDIEPLY